MKVVLMGTPGFVVPIFDKIASGHEVSAVFTRAPKPAGRKQIITKSPVHEWAESRGIPVHTSIREFDSPQSPAPGPDFIIVAAYGVILRDNVLNAAPCINIHPSDLPKYRGADGFGVSCGAGKIPRAAAGRNADFHAEIHKRRFDNRLEKIAGGNP
jgi:methionyl-tRNA formyltransferase